MPPPAALAKLPKPVLFGLYGGVGGLLGALLFGELLWFVLKPAPPAAPPPPPPPPPQVAVTASPDVQVYAGGSNTFAVSVARGEFDGPVTLRLEDAGPGLTLAPLTIPAGQTNGTATLSATPAAVGKRKVKLVADATALGKSLTADTAVNVQVDAAPPRGTADIVFALDVTGSMGPFIRGLKSGVSRFVEEIRGSQLDVRVGLVAFGDLRLGEMPIILPFSTDAVAFGQSVGNLRMYEGGDEPESSLEGVADAAGRFQFRPGAARVVILITDAPPAGGQLGANDNPNYPLAEEALKTNQVSQLHLVIRPQHEVYYKRLQELAPGKIFNLASVAGRGDGSAFAAMLPDIGRDITRAVAASPARRPEVSATPEAAAVPVAAVRGVQSSQEFEAGSGGRLVAAIAAWTAAIAGLVCLALAAGQFHYLRAALPSAGVAAAALGGGLAAGLVGGAAGQGLFLLAPDSAVLDKVFRVLGWAALGGLAGAGLAFFIPNLKTLHGLLGGAAGGAAGALAFIAVAALGSDIAGRLLGGLALGFCIGLMVAIAEVAFRSAWLEVWHGPREMITVNLGAEPVRVGGDARQCTVWARGAAPVALRFWVRDGRVVCADAGSGREDAAGAGFERAVGSVRVVVRTGSGAAATAAPPRPAAPPPRPAAARPGPASIDPYDDLPMQAGPKPLSLDDDLPASPRPAPAPAPVRTAVPPPPAVKPPAPPQKPASIDPYDDMPMPVAAPKPPAAPPKPPMPVAAPKPPAPPAAPKPPMPVAAPKPPAPPAKPAAPAAKPPTPAAPAPKPATDPDACPFCKGKHPGRPGTRYCVMHDQTY